MHLEASHVVVQAQAHGRRDRASESEAEQRLGGRLAGAADGRVCVVEAGTHGGESGTTGKAPRWRELPTVAACETEAADLEDAAELGAKRRRIAPLEVA